MAAKSVKIEFANSLPLGTHGSFKHDGQHWIAYPASKFQAIIGCIDQLIGVHSQTTKDMIRWINSRPQDAELVSHSLAYLTRARVIHRDLIMHKTKVRTK